MLLHHFEIAPGVTDVSVVILGALYVFGIGMMYLLYFVFLDRIIGIFIARNQLISFMQALNQL